MKNPGEFVLALLNARTVAHVQHLSQKGQVGSDAAHRALEAFYDGLLENTDRFAEAYMGCYGEVMSFGAAGFKLEKDSIKFVQGVKDTLAAARAELDEPMLQQIIDDMTETCARTLYRLKNLK